MDVVTTLADIERGHRIRLIVALVPEGPCTTGHSDTGVCRESSLRLGGGR
jgi:hypothetical protein